MTCDGDPVYSNRHSRLVPPLLPALRLPGGGGNRRRAPLRGDELRNPVAGPGGPHSTAARLLARLPDNSGTPPASPPSRHSFAPSREKWAEERERRIFGCRSGCYAKWVGGLDQLLKTEMETQRHCCDPFLPMGHHMRMLLETV